MRILNFGSLNLDIVFDVDHIAREGETIASSRREVLIGGKGLNQSIALSRAGAEVYHAGAVGVDGAVLVQALKDAGVHTRYVQKVEGPSGQAVIQLAADGQNTIITHMGANGCISKAFIDEVLSDFKRGDLLILQNEISNVPYAIERASRSGIQIAINLAPITPPVFEYPLDLVDILIVNETEGAALAEENGESGYESILSKLHQRFPHMLIVLTVGKDGVLCCDRGQSYRYGVYRVPVIDSTGAGDTFSGFFIAYLTRGSSVPEALEYASCAGGIAVTKKGAAACIPTRDEVEAFRRENTVSYI